VNLGPKPLSFVALLCLQLITCHVFDRTTWASSDRGDVTDTSLS